MTEVARMLNKYVYVDHLLIELRSLGNYKRNMDALYARNGQAHLCIADEALYHQRKAIHYGMHTEKPSYTIHLLEEGYEINCTASK
jgi:hypothetical protein